MQIFLIKIQQKIYFKHKINHFQIKLKIYLHNNLNKIWIYLIHKYYFHKIIKCNNKIQLIYLILIIFLVNNKIYLHNQI